MFKFLELNNEAFGLDIDDFSIKIVKLKKTRKTFVAELIKQTKINPGIIENGVIKNKEELVKILKQSIKEPSGRKISTDYAVISFPEEKSFLEIIKMPKMDKNDLSSALLFEIENYVPMPQDQIYFDFDVLPPASVNQDHTDVLIVAAPKTIIEAYLHCLKEAGIIPIAIEIKSHAIARALIKNQQSDSPVMIIDFGENAANLIIFSGKSIRFTASLSMSSAPDNLLEQVKKYIDFYREHSYHDHLADNKITKIIFCKSAAQLPEIVEFFSSKLNIETEIGNPWINVNLEKSNNFDSKKNYLLFSAAIGLAIRGAGKQNND